MANWIIGLFTRWSTVNGRNEMAVAQTYPSQGSFGSEAGWTDLGQQDGPIITARSALYCTLAMGKVDDTLLAAINADSHYLILARYEADTITPSFDNRQSVVTLAQKNAFVNYFNTEFGIDVSKVPDIANSVGQTRIQVLRNIVDDLRNLR